jgi:hypothetical protein
VAALLPGSASTTQLDLRVQFRIEGHPVLMTGKLASSVSRQDLHGRFSAQRSATNVGAFHFPLGDLAKATAGLYSFVHGASLSFLIALSAQLMHLTMRRQGEGSKGIEGSTSFKQKTLILRTQRPTMPAHRYQAKPHPFDENNCPCRYNARNTKRR